LPGVLGCHGEQAVTDDEAKAKLIEAISAQIQPLLKGHDPDVQCGVIADLLSLWLAGHWPHELRIVLLSNFVDLVRALTPESERQLFGPRGHPAGWA
jgi:hypothetical protein